MTTTMPNQPTSDDHVQDALATLHDAGATSVPPWLALVSALASVRPEGIGATIDWLVEHRDALEQAFVGGREAPLNTALLPAQMHYEPELGFLDRSRDDIALRERYLAADIVGQRTFFQTTVYAITGIELEASDAELLEQIGNITVLADRRAWPMAVTRRVAARGGEYAAAVVAGLAMMGSPILGGKATKDCAHFLRRADATVEAGGSVDALVAEILARRERVMGFGRPVVGPDERVPVMVALLDRHGRSELRFARLLREAERAMFERRGLRTTAAAWAAASLSDFGMTPEQAEAVTDSWVLVCVYAQAVFSGERGLRAIEP